MQDHTTEIGKIEVILARTRNTSIKADKDDKKITIQELTRRKVRVNFGWGIMTLKKKLKENETLNEESDPNYFKPLFMSADDLIAPNLKR